MQDYNGNTTGLTSRPTVTISEPTGLDVRNSQSIRTPVERLADFVQYLMTNLAFRVADAVLDMATFRIQNVGTPTTAGDAAIYPVDRSQMVSVGQQVSASSGPWNTTSINPVDVVSVSIATHGRPVVVLLITDPSQIGYLAASTTGALGAFGSYRVLRDEMTLVGGGSFGVNQPSTEVIVPSPGCVALDTPAAGTYTYKLQASCGGTNQTISVVAIRLVVYEL